MSRTATAALMSFLCAVLFAPGARAAIISTAPLEDVVPHADFIVRGEVDLEARTVKVLKVYRGKLDAGSILVRNLQDFDPLAGVGKVQRLPPYGGPPPKEAFLFLQELDGRYHLVATGSPSWISPHASIKYIRSDGVILGYHQIVNPGGVRLVSEGGAWSFPLEAPDLTREALEKKLVEWMAKPRADRPRRPALSPDETRRFYGVIEPWIDYYRRRVVEQSIATDDLGKLTSDLLGLVISAKGELRRRGIEALLILATERGPDQGRRRHVEARFAALLAEPGPEVLVDPLLCELRSEDVFSNKETAARLVRRIGGEAVDRARSILLEHIDRSRDSTLATRAYWALKYMGLAGDAEKAWAARVLRENAERERRERAGKPLKD